MLENTVSMSVYALDEPSHRDISQVLGMRPAVYHVRLLKRDKSAYLPIPRLLGNDPEGILYIGCTDKAEQRFVDLRKDVWPRYKFVSAAGHAFRGNGAHGIGPKLSDSFLEAFRDNPMVFDFHGRATNEGESEWTVIRDIERQLLASYAVRYGELPPFNDAR